MKITCECLILSTEKCFCSTNSFVLGFKLKLVTFFMHVNPQLSFSKSLPKHPSDCHSYPQQLFSLWYMRELTWSEVRNHTTILNMERNMHKLLKALKGNHRTRKTLESWHMAKTVEADNNSCPLSRQYSILLDKH